MTHQIPTTVIPHYLQGEIPLTGELQKDYGISREVHGVGAAPFDQA